MVLDPSGWNCFSVATLRAEVAGVNAPNECRAVDICAGCGNVESYSRQVIREISGVGALGCFEPNCGTTKLEKPISPGLPAQPASTQTTSMLPWPY